MQIGIFARTFVRPTVEGVLDAVRSYGLTCFQFDTACLGLPSMPDEVDESLCDLVREATAERTLRMASLSGTFNMIHPDAAERARGLRQLGVLLECCARLDTSLVSLCTGTRDPHNMWRRHVDNDSPAAWRDLLQTMELALQMAEDHGVTLVIEPEVANVVDSAVKARQLLDEMQSAYLKVVFDGANIFHKGELDKMQSLLSRSIELLAGDIVMAHAKDLDHDGDAGKLAAGTGLLDYEHYLGTLHGVGFAGPILLHGLSEGQVPGCVTFLRETVAQVTA